MIRRFVRIRHQGRNVFARQEGDRYRLLSGPPWSRPRPLPVWVPRARARLLPPVEPSKIVAVGLNYRRHAQELNLRQPRQPVLFLKPPTALSAPGARVRIPAMTRRLDYEGELAVVIGRTARAVPGDRAWGFAAGLTLANDLTARDLQQVDGQWTRAKGFDGFCPLGPALVAGLHPDDLEIRTQVNGVLRQQGRTSDMIFDVPRIIAFVSEVMTLYPGDVILTGTPPGVGPLRPGDRVDVECDAIGCLRTVIDQ